jgi:phenylpropionate dioxygenase-like ring-hydroxylating dioxygenase large terminal subunit
MTYLRNTWYIAAWDYEVAPGSTFSRRLLDKPVVFYRDSNGTPHALANRCPHRFAPLHLSRVIGDRLQCRYHGLEFDGTGACVRNPQGDGAIPRTARVKAYPVAERHGALWIWMGDSAQADAERIPDFSSMDPAKRIVARDYLHARANYLLEVDNILDLSHIEFLHDSSLGSDAVKAAETSVEQVGHTVYSKRLTRNERLTEALERQYGIPPGTLLDRWLDTRWDAPGNMELWVGQAPAGSPDPRSVGKRVPFQHLFTPETATTTHYFFATSYPLRMGEEGRRRAEDDIRFLRAPFETEDLPMLEAQQSAMGDAEFWSLKPVLLPGDAAGVRARRVLDGLIKAEQAAPATTASHAA